MFVSSHDISHNQTKSDMETISIKNPTTTISSKATWTGRVISGLCILFLLVDAVMKIFNHPEHVKGTVHLQWSTTAVIPLGIVLLLSTLLHLIPRTAVLGAILLTGYLGGAVATMVRINEPYYFAVVFGVLVWVGLYLRNKKVRDILS